MSHTLGPWDHRQYYNSLKDEIGVKGMALATVWVRKQKPRTKDNLSDRTEPWAAGEANARLIAAAPELLETLRALVTECEYMTAQIYPEDYAREGAPATYRASALLERLSQ